jgi:uncharacterized protein YbaP (TraB family)
MATHTTWRPAKRRVGRRDGHLQLLTLRRLALLACLCWPLLASAGQISLWRIQHGQATLYLLGSIHAVRADMYPLPEAMDSAFAAADQVIFEIDLSQAATAGLGEIMAQRGSLPDGQTLATNLSPATLAQLTTFLQADQANYPPGQRLTLAAVQGMRPWYLAMLLGLRELTQLGYNPALGIDQHYHQQALAAGKTVFGLETFSEQIDQLAGESPQNQELALRLVLESSSLIEAQLAELISAWQSGQANHMYTLATATSTNYPTLDEQAVHLLSQRNQRMASRLKDFLQGNQTTLAVVGALHMGGEQGLLTLLDEDYTVTQLTAAGFVP